MKQSKIYFAIAFIIGIIALIMFFGCKGNSADGTTILKHKRDTANAFVMYLGYGRKYVDYGKAQRITVDTVLWVGKDSMTMKKEPTRFVYYLVNLRAQTDSLLAASYKIPRYDSTGKEYAVTITGIEYPREWVRDSITNWDSALVYLQKFIPKVDSSTIKK